jgi:hypothetical protein
MKELTKNKMKATTAITISLVVTLSLLLFAEGLVGSINNVLAKKDSSGSGGGGDKSEGYKGGSDKGTTHQASSDSSGGGGSKGNDNNNNNNGDNSGGDGGSSSSIATETRKPGSDFHGDQGLVSATCGAFEGKCMHPGDMTTTSPISPSGPFSCHKECGGGTPTPPVSTVTCNPGHHFVQTLGCVKDHLTHDEAFDLGCKLGTNDGEDQENFVGTGPHSSGFIRGYNQGFAGHSCDRHHGSSGGGGSGNGINTAVSGTATPLTTTTATKTTTTPVFKESTDIPVSTNVAIGPTTKTVDTAGWLHIVGNIRMMESLL